MPVVAPGSKILVTGANGFIAVWLVRSLLEQGFEVRGTVRSKQKSAFLVDMFKSYGNKFELVVVEDITKVRSPCNNCHNCLVIVFLGRGF